MAYLGGLGHRHQFWFTTIPILFMSPRVITDAVVRAAGVRYYAASTGTVSSRVTGPTVESVLRLPKYQPGVNQSDGVRFREFEMGQL
jgi:hypothetical protein